MTPQWLDLPPIPWWVYHGHRWVHGYNYNKDREFVMGPFTPAGAEITAAGMNREYRQRGYYYDVISVLPDNLTPTGTQ